jgi:protease-4
MHDLNAPPPVPPTITVIPARPAPLPPSPPPRGPSPLRWILALLLFGSVAFNCLLLAFVPGCGSSSSSSPGGGLLEERTTLGRSLSRNKVAVVRVEGGIMEGMIGFAQRQLERAAADRDVKAVVVRINSPGGSITASDDLHRRITEVRDGNPTRRYDAKPVVASMASIAASGGYYVAMPARFVVAERTTITGSIGVYASFPNVAALADKYGVTMNVIKAGEVKDSGSMFHVMSPQERKLWQEMVDQAFDQFLAVVEQGRPNLKGKLRDVVVRETITGADGKPAEYVRKRADGGIWTAAKAKELGLVDEVGYLERAVEEAAKLAGLGDDYRVIQYDRPLSLFSLFGGDGLDSQAGLDVGRLAEGAVPRLWYLAPQCELAGILSAIKPR